MLAVVIAEGVAIALLAILVLGLLRSHALILKALHELGAGLELEREAGADGSGSAGPVPVQIEPGVVPNTRAESSAAHDVVGTDLAGTPRLVGLAGSSTRPTLLAFLTSGCSVCQTFWEELGPDTATPGDARLVVVAKGTRDESPAVLTKLARPGVEVVSSSGAWVDYDIPGSPYFVLVEGGVVTGEGSATSWPAVRDLLQQAVEESAHARAAAGRTGPGAALGAGGHEDLGRIDAELLAAGIAPGHPSLFEPADPVEEPGHAHHDHDSHDHGSHDHGHPEPRPRPRRAPPRPRALPRPGAPHSRGRPVSVTGVALVIGLPMAVVAAVRATWSP